MAGVNRMHPQFTLILFFGGQEVGISRDISLIFEPRQIDITSKDSPWPEFIPALPTWKIQANNIEWNGNPDQYMTSTIALLARIQDNMGGIIMEGNVIIEQSNSGGLSNGPISYSATFRGQGALVKTDGVIDYTPLDSSPWYIRDNSIVTHRGEAIGFALSRGEKVMPRNELNGMKINKISIDDNSIITTKAGTEEGTEDSDRGNSDTITKGFRIVP